MRSRQGAEGFITKPFQFEELLHALNSAIEQRRLQVGERVPPGAARRIASASTALIGERRMMRDLFDCSRPSRRRRAPC